MYDAYELYVHDAGISGSVSTCHFCISTPKLLSHAIFRIQGGQSQTRRTLHSLVMPETKKMDLTYALTQPSFSQLFMIWAQRPHITFPELVTNPNSLTLTSMMVPFVRTPSCVYMGFWGFFLTEMIGNWTVTPSSGCVTLAYSRLVVRI
jgi:polyferredoxin